VILQSYPSDARAWVLIGAPACMLALPRADAGRFGGLSERVAEADGFRAALEFLLAGGIAGAPSFALIDGDSAVARVVLRGPATVSVTSTDPDAAEVTISGEGMATWSERVLEGARSLLLQVPGSTWTVELKSAAPAALPATITVSAPVLAEDPAPATVETPRDAETVAEATLVPSAQIEVPVPVPVPVLVPVPMAVPVAVVAAAPGASATVDAAATSTEPEPYDFLFGDTIYRTQAGASIRIPNPDPERPGDHDGRTMLAEDLGLKGHQPDVPVAPDASEATVFAPIPGHVPAVGTATSTSQAATLQLTPTLQLERADRGRESLSVPVVIGRAPSVSPVAAVSGPHPRLITILDDKDISRSHLRVAVEGDVVVVTDLASKNGTLVTLPGGSPRKLRGNEPTVVLPGTVIDLGGGVSFTVRED